MTKTLLVGLLVPALLTLFLPKDSVGQAFNYQPAFTINSQTTESNTGRHVSAAGDVNNDGVGDFSIGERVSTAGLGASEVSVYSGSDGSLLQQFSGLGTSDARGMGDVNNDGHSD